MRVLYFTEKDSPHDRRFLRALAETQHQVFALRQKPSAPETPEGITEVHWGEGYPDWSAWQGWREGQKQLSDILEVIQPDLVHAGPVQGPALLTALAGFHPMLTMSWGSDLLLQAKRSPWMRWATAYTLERTDILLADCQTVADEAVGYGFPQERIVKFPWGVDLEHFSPENSRDAGRELRESLGWEEYFIIFCNRTWSPVYGVDVLAEVFIKAAEENRRLRLLLAGSGPQSDVIRQILLPVKDRVAFSGQIERESLPGFYGAADLFVSPSHCDGSSVSLLEALACGRPVLVSDIPSNQEWVKPGVVGDLFKDGDAASLRRHLLQMVAEPRLAEYGKRARVLAERRADWKVNFSKLLDAYEGGLQFC